MSVTESKSELFTIAGADIEETDPDKGNRSRRIATIFERYVQPCLAEVLGSTLFIFVGCVSVVGSAGLPGCLQPALAHGLALAVSIMMFGEISGGHFNPIVSLGVYMCGGMDIILLGPYVVAQMLGAMIGAGLTKVVSPADSFNLTGGGAFNLVKTTDAVVGATVAEVVLTLVLIMVVCMGAINGRSRTQLAPLFIGLTVTANILAGAAISGGCMNPARAFGPAVVTNHWEYHWIYWVGPIAGTLFAVSFMRLLFGDQKTRVVLK